MNAHSPAVATTAAHDARSAAEFLAAWREAVDLIGAQYFLMPAPTDRCHSLADMQPKIDMLRSRLPLMSSGESVFVRCILQLVDDRAVLPHERPTMPEIAARLDVIHLRVLMRLLRHYNGW